MKHTEMDHPAPGDNAIMNRSRSSALSALLALGVAAFSLGSGDASADDQRYTMQVCRGNSDCVFILDTQTGEVRFCHFVGCRVLDSPGQAAPPPVAWSGPPPAASSGAPVVAPPPNQTSAVEPAARQPAAKPAPAAPLPSPFPEASKAASAEQQAASPAPVERTAPPSSDDAMPSPFPYSGRAGQALHQ